MSTGGPTTLVQLVSSPHSGSTILGVILGSADEVVYGGEMDRIPDPVWHSGLQCSCGQPTAQCPFWSEVRRRFEPAHSVPAFEAGQRRFEPWSALGRTVAARTLGSPAFRQHAEETAAFVQAVAASAGRSIVIDSSKLVGRSLVYAAARSPSLRVRYLHLVRDGRSVLSSRRARRDRVGAPVTSPRFATRMARRWVVANLAYSTLLARQRPDYLRLRHEDLLRDPEGTLRLLERFLGVSLAAPLRKLCDGSVFPVVHVPTGNRFRLTGEVRFRRPEGTAPDPAAAGERRAFWRVAGPLARWYGYQ